MVNEPPLPVVPPVPLPVPPPVPVPVLPPVPPVPLLPQPTSATIATTPPSPRPLICICESLLREAVARTRQLNPSLGR